MLDWIFVEPGVVEQGGTSAETGEGIVMIVQVQRGVVHMNVLQRHHLTFMITNPEIQRNVFAMELVHIIRNMATAESLTNAVTGTFLAATAGSGAALSAGCL